MGINIGICSDDEETLHIIGKRIENVISNMKVSCRSGCIITIDEPEKLVAKEVSYDILFADLDMKDVGGIGLIAQLAKLDSLQDTVLITDNSELVFEASKLRPFRIIRKQKLSEELDETMGALLGKFLDETMIYEANHAGDSGKIRLKDVEYIECKGHYLSFHTHEHAVVIRGTISEFEEKLAAYGFLRVHRGYLANIRRIYSINARQISLDSGKVLPISRKNARYIKTKYDSYIKQFVRGIR